MSEPFKKLNPYHSVVIVIVIVIVIIIVIVVVIVLVIVIVVVVVIVIVIVIVFDIVIVIVFVIVPGDTGEFPSCHHHCLPFHQPLSVAKQLVLHCRPVFSFHFKP